MARGKDKMTAFMRGVVKGLIGRVLGIAMLFGGFWLLYLGFLRPNPFLWALGVGTILLGMTVLVQARRS